MDEPAASLDELVAGGLAAPGTSPQVILKSLEAKGLVTRWSGKPVRYAAVAPDVAIDVLVRKREEELRQARHAMAELTERWRRVDRAIEPREMVEIVAGRTATVQRADQIQRTSVHEVLIFDKPPYATEDSQNPTEMQLLGEDGPRYRCLYDRRALDVPGKHDSIARSVAAGEEARVIRELPLKMVMGDQRIAIVPLQTEPEVIEVAAVIHPSALLEAVHMLFETLWAQSMPLRFDTASGDATARDHPDQQIVRLLITGLTDKAIGRQLKLGERTVQRRVAELMRRHGVANRLQLGIRLSQDGWV